MGNFFKYLDDAVDRKERRDQARYSDSFLYSYLRVSAFDHKFGIGKASFAGALFCAVFLTLTHLARTTIFWMWILFAWPFIAIYRMLKQKQRRSDPERSSDYLEQPRTPPAFEEHRSGAVPDFLENELCIRASPGRGHQVAIANLGKANFSGGSGEMPDIAIRIERNNIEALRNKFRETAWARIPPELRNDCEFLDGAVAEMIKWLYLQERFGMRDKDWFPGNRFYLESAMQSQEIIFSSGDKMTLFFDFSELHGPF